MLAVVTVTVLDSDGGGRGLSKEAAFRPTPEECVGARQAGLWASLLQAELAHVQRPGGRRRTLGLVPGQAAGPWQVAVGRR